MAIPPESVEVIGVLPPVDSVTGFQVTPVVGIIPPNLHYHASQDEVAAVFEMRWPKRCAWGATIRWISIAAAIRIASGSPGTSIILSGE
ncbi:nudix hydrolase YeaB [Klebsiella michiganensis]|uniref:Nudix hydrolase YeaB n=1 Tax=Klebsiella michiganensis TaxID=1134687 RepID=A0A7H4MWL1_9ENTR|nr:nudix hydrolase YeaB [Klebsiella michiganensis]